jgi:ATP-dependent DNA helicase PIF1
MKVIDPSLNNKSFEGKVVVFGGDFCQILPVIVKGGRKDICKDIVKSCLQRSVLWSHVKLMILKINMRLYRFADKPDIVKQEEFARWLLGLEKAEFKK